MKSDGWWYLFFFLKTTVCNKNTWCDQNGLFLLFNAAERVSGYFPCGDAMLYNQTAVDLNQKKSYGIMIYVYDKVILAYYRAPHQRVEHPVCLWKRPNPFSLIF